MALTKQEILKHAGAFTATEVHVPEWADESGDDVVLVRGMTIREYEINQTRADDGLATASVMVRCVLDEDGGRLFDDADAKIVAELPLAQMKLVSKVIMQQSGIGDDDEPAGTAEIKALADAEGNSAPTPDVSSSSD